ncbi:MAG: hypothetical protein AMXMBFR53_27570 [Gemmatimonadota bacterium]
MSRARGGFTLVEVVVAVVVLSVGALALLGSSRVSATSLRRAVLETRVTRLLETEVERLRSAPLGTLANGTTTYPEGSTAWTVTDSVTYLRVELVVRARPERGASLVDTVWVYRPR